MPRKSSVAPKLVGLSNAFNRPEADTLDDVYDHIFSSIVDQRLPPGTKLNELTLCEIFNVGRRQVAQVLTRLSHDKLITLHANRGAFVAAPDVAEARTIFQARLTIECEITRMVATDATRDMLNPLRKNVEEETSHRMGDLSGNEILAGIVRQLVARTSLVVSLYENQSTMSCWHDDHGDFIKLLEAHRVQSAVTLMRKHLAHVEESLNFNSRARSPFDLRKIYAPSLRG
jgi:DNA-binding GntR family transcriptional regulator